MAKRLGCLAAVLALQGVLFSLPAQADSINYTSCLSQAKVLDVQVSESSRSQGVLFERGKSYTLEVSFEPAADHETSSVKVWGVINGVPIPFTSFQDESAASGLTKGGVTVRRLVANVLTVYPRISLTVRLEISGKNSVREVCVEFPVKIVGPNG